MLPIPIAQLTHCARPRTAFFCLALATLVFSFGSASAAWEHGDWAVVLEDPSHILDVGAWPDGQGGMFVAGVHQAGLGYHRIMLNKIDHAGTEVWGDGGIYLPINVTAEWDSRPLDLVADGEGGAYIAYRRGYGTYELYVVAHVDAAGSTEWVSNVDLVGNYSGIEYPEVRVAPGAYGGVYVVYVQFDGLGNEKLKSVHFDTEGAILDFTDVFSAANADVVTFDVATDMAGGVLVAWTRLVVGVTQTGAQRVNTSSLRLWGNDGVLIGTYIGDGHAVVGDGFGGAYVVVSLSGQAIGQHLDGGGNKLWAASGKMLHDTHTPFYTWSTKPDICTDGLGGLFLVHGLENVFVQKVDLFGGFPWGTAGVQVASGTEFSDQVGRIAYDGWGGAVLRYNTSYEIESFGVYCKQIQGVRIDGGGLILWDKYLWSCDWGWEQGVPEIYTWPHSTHVVADGSGGAMYAWPEGRSASGGGTEDLRVLARGVGPAGDPAMPSVINMIPGSGQPGDLLAVGIFGDYLEASQTFKLQLQGEPDLAITGNLQHSNQLIEGDLNLTGAAKGIYDLVVSAAGTPRDTLRSAFGVGDLIDCRPDEPFGPHAAQPITGGSRRQAAFANDGTANMAWCEFESSFYRIMHWEDPMSPSGGVPVFESTLPLRELSFGLGIDDSRHFTFVMDDGPDDRLYYIRQPSSGPDMIDYIVVSDGAHNPALEVFGGDAQIVFESDIGGSSWLFHVPGTATGLGAIQDIMSGANSREADLATGDAELILTFVRDLWVPGWREVCYQTFGGVTWDTPVPLYFGVSIYSPTVVWDNDFRTLFSWILDNTGSDPLLHTCLMEWDVPGPVRWRESDGLIYATTVDSPGSGNFYMLTQESQTGWPVKMYLRRGDGEAFYPKAQLNTSLDVDKPFFTVEYSTQRVVAWWEEYNDPAHPYHFIKCQFDVSGVPDPGLLAEAMMMVYPNPFNPSTTVTFALPEAGWIQLAIFDVRGRLVRTLADESFGVGAHRVAWDGRDDHGNPLASGVYFGKLTLPGGKGEKIQKMALIR